MEEPVAAEDADEEYMTMDAETWSEHDDTYENGDTLGLDLGGKEDSRGCESGHDSRTEKKEELNKKKVATKGPLQNTTKNPNTARSPIQTLPNRYITIRRPPMNANRGSGKKQPHQLVFLRRATVCLVLLCILLLGMLLGLGFYYDRLSQKTKTLLEQNNKLEEKIDNLRFLPIYHVSSTDHFCSTGEDLFILNHDVREWPMTEYSFYLGRRIMDNGNCWIPLSWKCTNVSTI